MQEQADGGDLLEQNNGLDEIEEIVNDPDADYMTTLDVSTSYQPEDSSTVYRIATIRSPYSFDVDEDGRLQSTRSYFITIIP